MFIISALNVYIYSINAAEALLHFLPSFSLLTQSGQDGPTLTSTFLTLFLVNTPIALQFGDTPNTHGNNIWLCLLRWTNSVPTSCLRRP
jgi:hypothetical protein